MPAAPTWLRRIPHAVEQLDAWTEPDVSRADLARLLKLKKARAVQLMHAWGATRRGGRGELRLESGALRRRLKALRRGTQLADEERRVERVVAVLHEARIAGVKVKVDPAAMGAKLAGLPEGVLVAPDRIVVEFTTAHDAITKLFTLAKALGNDWDRFEQLVERAGGATRRDA